MDKELTELRSLLERAIYENVSVDMGGGYDVVGCDSAVDAVFRTLAAHWELLPLQEHYEANTALVCYDGGVEHFGCAVEDVLWPLLGYDMDRWIEARFDHAFSTDTKEKSDG